MLPLEGRNVTTFRQQLPAVERPAASVVAWVADIADCNGVNGDLRARATRKTRKPALTRG